MNSEHRTYMDSIKASHPAVEIVSRWVRESGTGVILPMVSYAKNSTEVAEHNDSGDMFLLMRNEVKQLRKTAFTCEEDFPYRQIAVCNVSTWDAYDPKPVAHFIVSQGMECAAYVKSKTRHMWEEKVSTHHRKGTTHMCLYCPVGQVSAWIDLRDRPRKVAFMQSLLAEWEGE